MQLFCLLILGKELIEIQVPQIGNLSKKHIINTMVLCTLVN